MNFQCMRMMRHSLWLAGLLALCITHSTPAQAQAIGFHKDIRSVKGTWRARLSMSPDSKDRMSAAK